MTHPFDDALSTLPQKLLAWDLNERDGQRTLSVFDLAGGGARQVAWRRHPLAEVEQVSRELEAAGHALGGYDGHQPFVWRVSPESISVWSQDERVLFAQGDTLAFTYDRTVARSEIEAVLGYVDSDYVDRGLKVRRRGGVTTTVLFDLSNAASADPTYSRNDLIMDTEWIPTIGAALARWAGVSYESHL